MVERAAGDGEDPRVTFARIRRLADAIAAGDSIDDASGPIDMPADLDRKRPPRVTEPWFC